MATILPDVPTAFSVFPVDVNPVPAIVKASVIPYPFNVVGLPVVILDQSRDGISEANNALPAVTCPFALTVTFG